MLAFAKSSILVAFFVVLSGSLRAEIVLERKATPVVALQPRQHMSTLVLLPESESVLNNSNVNSMNGHISWGSVIGTRSGFYLSIPNYSVRQVQVWPVTRQQTVQHHIGRANAYRLSH